MIVSSTQMQARQRTPGETCLIPTGSIVRVAWPEKFWALQAYQIYYKYFFRVRNSLQCVAGVRDKRPKWVTVTLNVGNLRAMMLDLSVCCRRVVSVLSVLSVCCQSAVSVLSENCQCVMSECHQSVVCIFYCMRTWCVVWERRGLSNIATVTRGGGSLKLVNCWLSCSLICMCVIHSWMWKTIFQPDVVLILLWVHACVSYCKWVTVYVCIRCLSVCVLSYWDIIVGYFPTG